MGSDILSRHAEYYKWLSAPLELKTVHRCLNALIRLIWIPRGCLEYYRLVNDGVMWIIDSYEDSNEPCIIY